MSLVEKIHADMVWAMKQRAVDRLSTLRMVKAALKNKGDRSTCAGDRRPGGAGVNHFDQAAEGLHRTVHQREPAGAGGKRSGEIVVIEELHAESGWG